MLANLKWNHGGFLGAIWGASAGVILILLDTPDSGEVLAAQPTGPGSVYRAALVPVFLGAAVGNTIVERRQRRSEEIDDEATGDEAVDSDDEEFAADRSAAA